MSRVRAQGEIKYQRIRYSTQSSFASHLPSESVKLYSAITFLLATDYCTLCFSDIYLFSQPVHTTPTHIHIITIKEYKSKNSSPGSPSDASPESPRVRKS